MNAYKKCNQRELIFLALRLRSKRKKERKTERRKQQNILEIESRSNVFLAQSSK